MFKSVSNKEYIDRINKLLFEIIGDELSNGFEAKKEDLSVIYRALLIAEAANKVADELIEKDLGFDT